LMHETATKLEQIINDAKANPKLKAEAMNARESLNSLRDPQLAQAEAAQKGRAKEVEGKYPVKPGSLQGKPDPFAAPKFPANYQGAPKTLDSSGSGGANYSAADLAALKKRMGI